MSPEPCLLFFVCLIKMQGMSDTTKQLVEGLLSGAGVSVNGPEPWSIQVHNDRFYRRVLSQGELGFGEAYMDGWWDCEAVDELVNRLLRADIRSRLKAHPKLLFHALSAALVNQQGTRRRAFQVGEQHYDVGNDLYSRMLDKRMVYTCGYWKQAKNLDEAQEHKLDLVCRKIGLKAGDHVLDIGCGWGSFAQFAAERYGARVTGVTVSKEQLALGRKRCEGLPVELFLKDYREITGAFDHVVSLGMFEHVGYKNYRTYMRVVRRVLKNDGLFLLHTIGGLKSAHSVGLWINKYIFPNSMLPSARQITKATEGLFVLEDWHNFGPYYDQTLMAWDENVERAWPELNTRYGERFQRMWRYYLLACAGTFRSRTNQLWQIVLSKGGRPRMYERVS